MAQKTLTTSYLARLSNARSALPLSRLKLSNTALSAIYVISVSAVQHRKQGLKRDGFGVTDSNVTFDQVVANF